MTSCLLLLPDGLQVQRSDDTEEKAVNRLRTYHANVDAVIGYYKEQLVEVRSCGPCCSACLLTWVARDCACRLHGKECS